MACYVRDKQPLADKSQVVEARTEVGQHRALANPAFAREQAALVKGDGICAGNIAVHYPRAAVRGAHADASFRNLGGIQVALRIEYQIVRRDDVTAHGADGFDLAGIDIDGA